MKNIKVATVNIRIKDLFFKWVEITRPFHRLTPSRQKVLSLLLFYHYKFRKYVSSDKILWDTVFDYNTRVLIKEELDLDDAGFNNILYSLRKSKIIKNNIINEAFIPKIEQEAKNFKIVFNFNIIHGNRERQDK